MKKPKKSELLRVDTFIKYLFQGGKEFDAMLKVGQKYMDGFKEGVCIAKSDYCGVEPNMNERITFAHFKGCKCQIPELPKNEFIETGEDSKDWWIKHYCA